MTAHPLYLIVTALDPSLGKVDKSSLSQQTLMDLLTQEIAKNRESVIFDPDNPPDLSDMTLDDNGCITEINWSAMGLNGTIHLEWIPLTVKEFALDENSVEGTVDVSLIPESMVEFSLIGNRLSGEIALESLPNNLKEFDVTRNVFVGTLNLENLPKALTLLGLAVNFFTGTVNLTCLPNSLAELSVYKNHLSGKVDVTRLPSSMRKLLINENDFEGNTDFSQIPDSLIEFSFAYTKLSGEVYVSEDKSFYGLFSDVVVHRVQPRGIPIKRTR